MDIRFINAGCGDAIHIRFEESPLKFRNILIDGGTEKGDIYDKGLRQVLSDIITAKERVDLWIITHIDDDHIGGILRLLKDDEILAQLDLSQTQFWYNFAMWDYDTGIRTDQKKNVSQAIRLREWLISGSPVNQCITDAMVSLDLWGVKCSVLSPTQPMMEKMLKEWKKEEVKIRSHEIGAKKIGANNDYKIKLDDLDLDTEYLDRSVENNSSIAIILEYQGERILLTADASPKVLAGALQRYGNGAPVKFKYVQVPHHGSKYNTNNEFLGTLDCTEFIITGDGFNRSALPNKYTLAKILKAKEGIPVVFHLTAKNELTESFFAVDDQHVIDVRFPPNGSNGLTFSMGSNGSR